MNIPQDLLAAAEASIDAAWHEARPSDEQLVQIVMLATGAPHGVAEEWLCDFAGPH